jgi:hypothetical protein
VAKFPTEVERAVEITVPPARAYTRVGDDTSDTPVPRLLQGLIRSFVEREAATAVEQYLANVKRALEAS